MWQELKQTAGGANEMLLFHGTKEANLDSITRHGFLRDYNEVSAYGKGSYFAKNASYPLAEQYTEPNAKGERFMLLTRGRTASPTLLLHSL